MSILMIAAAAAALQLSPTEETLVEATIAELRPFIPVAEAARFRRVHLRTGTGQDGREHTVVCGQVEMDDPRAAPGWQVFAGAIINGRPMVMLGNYGLASAARFCTPAPGDRWDYDRDLSGLFAEEIAAQ